MLFFPSFFLFIILCHGECVNALGKYCRIICVKHERNGARVRARYGYFTMPKPNTINYNQETGLYTPNVMYNVYTQSRHIYRVGSDLSKQFNV